MVLKSKNRSKFGPMDIAPFGVRLLVAGAILANFYQITEAQAQTNRPAIELDPSRPLLSRDGATTRPLPGRTSGPNSPPSKAPNAPVFRPFTSAIESDDLAPVIDSEGTGLPIGVWHGLNVPTLEKLFAKMELPPRSPILNDLWLRFLTNRDVSESGMSDPALKVLRLETLFRSGHFQEILNIRTAGNTQQTTRHMVEFIKAKAELGLGDEKTACDRLRNAGPAGKGMPRGLALQLLKMTIYCRAQAGDIPGANLVVDLAREQGIEAAYAVKAVYALESKRSTAPRLPKTIGMIDYKFATLFKKTRRHDMIDRAGASAPVLAAMVNSGNQPQDALLRIAERAFKRNIIRPGKMADIYSRANFNTGDLNNPQSAIARYQNRPEGRALLYRAIEIERDPVRRAQLSVQLMTSARAAGLYIHIAKLLKGTMERLPQTGALAWFAESAIEISLASGEYEKALSWAVFGSTDAGASPRNLLNWLTLIDIGAPESTIPNGAGLSTTEEAAHAGQFSPDTLHRLVTILDALKYDVPIGLWNRASSAPQPKSGHLPETGVLSELQAASGNRQYGKVILYSIIALGRDGPPGAHMIALGDSIKAMSAIGLQDEARSIALEALFAVWPRLASH